MTHSKNKLLIAGFGVSFLLFSSNGFTARPICPCEDAYREAASRIVCAVEVTSQISSEGQLGTFADLFITGYANGVQRCADLQSFPYAFGSDCYAVAGVLDDDYCDFSTTGFFFEAEVTANETRACANVIRELARTTPECNF